MIIEERKNAMKTANTKPVIKSIKLPNQVKLQYVEQGDPAGVPVIMLHGITDSWHSFEPVLPHLRASVRAFALSQRGHGDSERPATGYHPRDFAADVAAFMDALELERAVIAGHSMGSHITRRFALDYPDRVLGIVLMATFFRFEGNPAVAELRDAVLKFSDPIDPSFALEFQLSTLAREIPQELLDTFVRESLKAPARVWRDALEGLREDDHSVELGGIKAPTLIVWGDRDAFCPRNDQDALAAAIAGSKLLVYHGAGHALHWEEPERFAADLVAFADNLVH